MDDGAAIQAAVPASRADRAGVSRCRIDARPRRARRDENMKALLCTAFGPIDHLRIDDVAMPEPAAG